VSIRKIAGLAAGFALAVGLIGNGVSAQWAKTVTAQENISVGSFGCAIVDWTGAPAGHTQQESVTFTAPPINSSDAGTAPFMFTVKNTGTVAQVLTVASTITTLPTQFSDMLGTQSPVFLAGNAAQVYNGGLSWTDLTSYTGGATGNITYTVTCNENAPAVIFDNTTAVLPTNLASVGYQATQTAEFGAQVQFAGTARKLSTATVTMSSWACQSGDWNVPFGTAGACVTTTPGATYSVPITFNVYANAAAALAHGPTIATKTQTFAIPYRPSSIAGGDNEAWNAAGNHGLAVAITFTFAGETLPSTAIFGIAYNTDTWGYAPVGTTGPVDSLNVGVRDPASVGTFSPDGSVYWNTKTAANYTDLGVGGTGTFRPDSGWVGQMPAVQIVASY
jgi:hypothetical protein